MGLWARNISSDLIDPFYMRHTAVTPDDLQLMCEKMGLKSPHEVVEKTIPHNIRYDFSPHITPVKGENETLHDLRKISVKNKLFKNFIGMGYHDSVTPPVLLRNILQSPLWYTPYTPYQPEISQGRLEALINYQTVISDLTGLPFSNASLLDEGTAAAEAAAMTVHRKNATNEIFISEGCHPQTISVVKTRMKAIGVKVHVGNHTSFNFRKTRVACAIVQYPATDGSIYDYHKLREQLTESNALLVASADILSLTLLNPPSEWGADIVLGTSQRFGVPLGAGGPHAAYLSCSKDLIRSIPGRIIGMSHDSQDKPALRMALQTREQHIRREKATSNICTSQALLASLAGFYAVYHGPSGLRRIALDIRRQAMTLEKVLKHIGFEVNPSGHPYFDTIQVMLKTPDFAKKVIAAAAEKEINIRHFSPQSVSVSLDEATTLEHLKRLCDSFAEAAIQSGEELTAQVPNIHEVFDNISDEEIAYPESLSRKSEYLTHPIFQKYQSETEMMRYLHYLASKDYGLQTGMIPLGSCTMKLNAAAEMIPLTWFEFSKIHPFAPADQIEGYLRLFSDMETMLATLTGFTGCTLQPNAGSQGEFTGLLIIKKYHEHRGESQRDVCLIPTSAHGTNPASVMTAGLKVRTVECDERGNVCLVDLKAKVKELGDTLAALMITYPSTHGVFEEDIREICDTIHQHGGQVYMDGANMNAQCGITSPGFIGADVCHLNLHKTFCIPHGGGGPGMGPLCVASHLVSFLPSHPFSLLGLYANDSIGTVSAAPHGSASILPISWMYIKLMGMHGLKHASIAAIVSANYMAHRIREAFPILYTNKNGFVGHEFIVDLRHFKKTSGVEAIDVAKRLQDYGFHAPTLAFPVVNTLMVEPTESEPLSEMNKFIDALLSIREEIREIEEGKYNHQMNVLKQAPHTQEECLANEWDRPYSREKAVYPLPSLRIKKFWPTVKRLNEVYGDRHLQAKRTEGDLPY
eukprot:CAMPEP_0201499850 /NCGR_PEP_ID=MMETSP0151_2-20130828/78315_1 /ASSEMBLY_ACC=CAM_ASM_000257 /TAXON_ID=200890 /ORGANISM="Paramoeba atlantica, Strain 621/1 / CCAP 1560/9" /LENGTH=976 /DNA_ID=CAMNT_0047892577 /DNA_START=242 /DNA_END=3172 /DNA_ORIENTATION=+